MMLYVIDGLEPAEREEIDRLLASGDSEALEALRDAHATVASLPDALPASRPDPRVLDQLLKRARAESDVAGRIGSENAFKTSPGNVLAVLALAAGLLVGVSVGAGGMFLLNRSESRASLARASSLEATLAKQEQQLDDQRESIERATLQINDLRSQIASQQALVASQTQALDNARSTLALLLRPGVSSTDLAGTPERPAASGRIVWDSRSGDLRFSARDLGPLEPDRSYELWFVTADQQTVSLGLLEVAADGELTLATRLDEVPTNIALAAVSLEPAGGSPEAGPTGPILMAGTVR
jgi:anti-sigma-K factor RskA